MRELKTREEVDALLDERAAVLLKHGARCPISAAARDEMGVLAERAPHVVVGGVEVTGQPELSDYVEQKLGVRHASPQAFAIARGAVVWRATHHGITAGEIAAALGSRR